MKINAEREDGTVIAKANGRIDSSNSREFHSSLEAVTTEGDTAVVLDFDDAISEVFKISGFDKIIPIHSSKPEALAAVSV